ncbi:hypothetical protein GCK32_016865 [Trichostrongylus colubriformis]|uniref:Uncharacterized protein n=1 Tax=Trichostrongylus colubriformis TaxID=6319 RepID=A0AAN8IYY6_TRICO
MISFAAWPTETDIELYMNFAHDINLRRNNAFLVATLKKTRTFYGVIQSYTLLAATIGIFLLLVASMAAIVFCARRIAVAVRENGCAGTRRLNMQLHKLLFAQVRYIIG